jgi:putative ABC transport system permease protein
LLFLSELEPGSGPAAKQIAFGVRATGDPATLPSAILEAIKSVEPALPVFEFTTQEQLIADRFGRVYRFALTWILLSAVALLLTCIGLYGLVAYLTSRRTVEVGIRIALGAQKRQIVQLLVGQTFRLVLLGLVLGLGASLAINQIIRRFLFGVTLYDPLTMGAVVVLSCAIASAACYPPVRKALQSDITGTLRRE